MASEAQKTALAKARASKKTIEAVSNDGSHSHTHSIDAGHNHSITVESDHTHRVEMHYYDTATLHREIEAAAESLYHGRRLYINVAYAPVADESVAHTVFGGVPVRSSVRKELVLSNGETISFEQAV